MINESHWEAIDDALDPLFEYLENASDAEDFQEFLDRWEGFYIFAYHLQIKAEEKNCAEAEQ